MAHPEEDNAIYWYDPDPRTIIPLEAFHVPRRLARTLRQGKFELQIDSDFEGVMRACAQSAPGRETSWISEEIIELYTDLHNHGFAHSVEAYLKGDLVGGVYGVSIRGLFAGESMFSRVTDASKVALVYLMQNLKQRGFVLFDVQFTTQHLQRFGAIEIPRSDYQRRLRRALTTETGGLANFCSEFLKALQQV
jgi:leucyl/phenylalanyl-tRNA--protein transferase